MTDRMRDTRDECYLGDALYVSFDGFMLKLRAPRQDGDHLVFLEPEVYHALTEYVARLRRKDEPDE